MRHTLTNTGAEILVGSVPRVVEVVKEGLEDSLTHTYAALLVLGLLGVVEVVLGGKTVILSTATSHAKEGLEDSSRERETHTHWCSTRRKV